MPRADGLASEWRVIAIEGRGQGVNEQASFDLPLPKYRRKRQSVAPARPKDAAFAEALRDAADIRQWTDDRVAPWRVYRLAQALAKVVR